MSYLFDGNWQEEQEHRTLFRSVGWGVVIAGYILLIGLSPIIVIVFCVWHFVTMNKPSEPTTTSDDFEHACDIELAQMNARLLNLTHGFYIDCAHCGATEFFEGEWDWTDKYFCCQCQQIADFYERIRRSTRKSSKAYDSFDINLLPDLHSKTANKNERI